MTAYGSEGWGFESLRARFEARPVVTGKKKDEHFRSSFFLSHRNALTRAALHLVPVCFVRIDRDLDPPVALTTFLGVVGLNRLPLSAA